MIPKIREKNLLTRDAFDARILHVLNAFELHEPLPSYDEYVGLKTFDVDITVKCKEGSHVARRKLRNLIVTPTCTICTAAFSKPQHEIATFIRSLGFAVNDNDRSIIPPLEIDIFVPSKSFGIEFNGLYWHSELSTHKKNDVDIKHVLTEKRNINLLTVFEDEWRDKRQIIESMIRHRLGLSTRIHARKMRVIELTRDKRKEFFNETHLEGDVRAKIAFGLQNNDGDVVAALSLRNPFHKSAKRQIEIARYSQCLDALVVGGLSRLISHASRWAKENNYTSVMTYVDTRIGTGSGYVASGFSVKSETGPRFWWTDFVSRYDRFSYRATQEQTQEQVALAAGVHKIWGARNVVLEKLL